MRRDNLALAAAAVIGIGAAAVVMIFHHGTRCSAADEAVVVQGEDPEPNPSVDDLADAGEAGAADGGTGDVALLAVAHLRPLVLQGDAGNESHIPPPVILTNLLDPAALANRYDEWGVQESLIAYGQNLSKDPMTWQPEVIDSWVHDNVPPEFNGYLALDWETGLFNILIQHSPIHPDLDAAIDQFIGLIEHVKALRPRCKVGYYLLPVGGNTSDPGPVLEHCRRLQPIFDAADVLFPSYYLRDDFDMWKLGVTTWLPMVLEVAKEKPVFPYTWHRYSTSTPGGYRLVPAEDYIRHIRHLLNIESDGKRVTGVVAWGADKSEFENSQWIIRGRTFGNKGLRWDNTRAAFATEMAPGEDIDAYLNRLYARVYSLLAKAGNQAVPDSEPPP